MKGTCYRANGSEFADSAFSNVVANFRQCIYCKQVIDMGYKPKFRQDPLIKHIQELAKNLSQICWFQALYVGGWNWQRSIDY